MGSESSDFEQRVLGTVKSLPERRDPPLIWAMEVSKCIQEKGLGIPNPELGHVLVSNLCFTNNNPTLWKFRRTGDLLSPSFPSSCPCSTHLKILERRRQHSSLGESSK